MKDVVHATLDGNHAAARVAYRLNEVIAIYPITPASPMGEHCDEWAAGGAVNIFGTVPQVTEMQAEGGAAGAVHGALQAGALTTTFTASQGLLLMLPNMFKIAGELTGFCMHVAARSVATHALSIFGDHSDVMAARGTGFALLASGSVQEAQDFACIGQVSSLRSRVPFLHFFDGFRTSHEIQKIALLSDETLLEMTSPEDIAGHRARALTPDRPVIRGTAQNPDVFFQAREAVNPFYLACPGHVQAVMDRFAQLTGRHYRLFDYVGHPEAERVVVMMGSGSETADETVQWMVQRGERVGLIKVRLYRPFDGAAFRDVLPASTRAIAVLDRTKEPGGVGEPLYLDVIAALVEGPGGGAQLPRIVGGRYGLSSKELGPAEVLAVYDNLARSSPKNHFAVGIVDDVTHGSLAVDHDVDIEPDSVTRAVFYGLGSDGTVSANKSTIKIIGEGTDRFVQAYFVYDSRKSGAMTISHLRFGARPIRSTYLIRRADFVACHQFAFLDKIDVLEQAGRGAVFLLNAPYPAESVWDHLPREVQETILERDLRLHVIDAYAIAREVGMGRRVNTIMQTAFFALCDLFPEQEALERIRGAIEEAYRGKGREVVRRNLAAVEMARSGLERVVRPASITASRGRSPIVPTQAPDFVQRVTAVMLARKGDHLPVSAFPVDGTWPLSTSQWEKRNVALEIPVWDPAICIQCNKCALVCPHAAIRAKVWRADGAPSDARPAAFKWTGYRGRELAGWQYTLQVAPEDCTGCRLCTVVCPVKDKANPRHKAIDMAPQAPIRDQERESYAYFLGLPEVDRSLLKRDVKGTQFLQPLFEYSGACAGCGETPYIKLLTQLFGDRALIANATGCSSIFGGNLPTTPYRTDDRGRGPAWSNSLFEDNAEFGFGMRVALDVHRERAHRRLEAISGALDSELVAALLDAVQDDEAGIEAQRERVGRLKASLSGLTQPSAVELLAASDYLVDKSVWIVGGDGWAYDIGYGGLDHVLASNRNVNILVLDTEVYSNTGGQQSKATPLGASAKFAMAGKEIPKKDLGALAMSYGNAYVAQVAFGAKDAQTVKAFEEAASFPGPSLIIAYCHCIAHGYDMAFGAAQQHRAVDCGLWPLYRYDPRRLEEGEPPLHLDSGRPKIKVREYMMNEMRFRIVRQFDPKRFERLLELAQHHEQQRYAIYQQLAGIRVPKDTYAEEG